MTAYDLHTPLACPYPMPQLYAAMPFPIAKRLATGARRAARVLAVMALGALAGIDLAILIALPLWPHEPQTKVFAFVDACFELRCISASKPSINGLHDVRPVPKKPAKAAYHPADAHRVAGKEQVRQRNQWKRYNFTLGNARSE